MSIGRRRHVDGAPLTDPLDRAVAAARITPARDAGVASLRRSSVRCSTSRRARCGPTLSRMVERGELTTDDATYRLSGRLLGRQSEQDTGRDSFDGRMGRVVVRRDRHRRSSHRWPIGARSGPEPSAPSSANCAPISGCAPRTSTCRPTWPACSCHAVPCSAPTMPRWPVRSGTRRRSTIAVEHSPTRSQLEVARSRDSGPGGLPATFVALAQALRHLRVEPQLPEQLHSPAAGDGCARPIATSSGTSATNSRPSSATTDPTPTVHTTGFVSAEVGEAPTRADTNRAVTDSCQRRSAQHRHVLTQIDGSTTSAVISTGGR